MKELKMRYKRVFSVLIVFTLFLGYFSGIEFLKKEPVEAEAETRTWNYDLNVSTGVLTIYGTGMVTGSAANNGTTCFGGYVYSFNGSYLNGIDKVKTVIIGEGITGLDRYALANCINLTSITFPSTFTYIGDYVFSGCKALTNMRIPDTVTYIGNCAFNCTYSLGSIYLPDSITEIGGSAFYNSGLGSVTLPKNLTKLGASAFSNCSNLSSVVMDCKITEISARTFYNAGRISSLIIPNTVTKIGSEAFCLPYSGSNHPVNLRDIYIPDSVTTIIAGAFSVTNMYPLNVHTANPVAKAYNWAADKWNVTYIDDYVGYGANLTIASNNTAYGTVSGSSGNISKDTPVTVTASPVSGYKFDGWYNGSTLVSSSASYTFNMPGSDLSLTAQFSQATFNLSFNSNGGSACASRTVIAGQTYTDMPVPLRTGYTFAGWTLASGVGTASYRTFTAGVGNATLIANWTVKSNTLIVNPNGGSWNASTSSSSFTMNYGEEKTITNPTRLGYTFTGWSLTGAGSIVGTKFTLGDGASTLTATWQPMQYTLSFNSDGGSACSSVTVIYGVNYSPLPEPTRFGYTFGGWAMASGAGSVNGSTFVVGAGDATLIAIWEKNKVTLTVDPNGGTWNGNTSEYSMLLDYLANVTVSDPVREGYTFTGWTIDGTCSMSGSQLVMSNYNVKLTANWSINTYRVTAMYQGGVDSLGNTMKTYDALYGSTFELEVPTRYGYHVDQWVRMSGKGSISGNAFTVDSGDAVLIPNWAANKHELKVDPNGGVWNDSEEISTFNVEYQGVKVILNPTRVGYTFNGWEVTGICTLRDLQIVMDDYDVTLKAKWIVNQYDVIVDPNGGKYNSSTEASSITQDYYSIVRLVNPTKTGYRFLGWQFTSELPLVESDTSSMSYRLLAENTKLTANWEPIEYQVVYHNNYGIDSTQAADLEYDTASNLKSNNTFSRVGYTFVSWNTKADGSGDSYSGNQNVLNLTTVDNAVIDLYAQWTVNYYDITFDPDGGSWSGNTDETVENLAYGTVKNVDIPVWVGRTFTGWNFSGAGSFDGTKFTVGDGESTFTAQWSINHYTIKFNGNGNTSGSMSDMSCEYDRDYNLTTNSFARYGYTFDGWSTTQEGEVEYTDAVEISNLTAVDGEEITLYAKWSANQYSIPLSLELEETSGLTGSTPYTCTFNEILTTTVPTVEGYHVVGWKVIDKNGVEEYTSATDAIMFRLTDYDISIVAVMEYDTFRVEFRDFDGNTVSVQTVKYGKDAANVTVEKEGYDFVGWDDYTNIKEDRIITSHWLGHTHSLKVVEQRTDKYGVTTETVLEESTVRTGDDYELDIPEVEGYHVTDIKVVTSSAITVPGIGIGFPRILMESLGSPLTGINEGDTANIKIANQDHTVKLSYLIDKYKVKFVVDGEVISEQEVYYGDEPVIPEAPQKEGFTFEKWKLPNKLLGDTVISPVWVGDGLKINVNEILQYSSGYKIVKKTQMDAIVGEYLNWSIGSFTGFNYSTWKAYDGVGNLLSKDTGTGNTNLSIAVAENGLTLNIYYTAKKCSVKFKIGDTVVEQKQVDYGLQSGTPSITEYEGRTVLWTSKVITGDTVISGTLGDKLYTTQFFCAVKDGKNYPMTLAEFELEYSDIDYSDIWYDSEMNEWELDDAILHGIDLSTLINKELMIYADGTAVTVGNIDSTKVGSTSVVKGKSTSFTAPNISGFQFSKWYDLDTGSEADLSSISKSSKVIAIYVKKSVGSSGSVGAGGSSPIIPPAKDDSKVNIPAPTPTPAPQINTEEQGGSGEVAPTPTDNNESGNNVGSGNTGSGNTGSDNSGSGSSGGSGGSGSNNGTWKSPLINSGTTTGNNVNGTNNTAVNNDSESGINVDEIQDDEGVEDSMSNTNSTSETSSSVNGTKESNSESSNTEYTQVYDSIESESTGIETLSLHNYNRTVTLVSEEQYEEYTGKSDAYYNKSKESKAVRYDADGIRKIYGELVDELGQEDAVNYVVSLMMEIEMAYSDKEAVELLSVIVDNPRISNIDVSDKGMVTYRDIKGALYVRLGKYSLIKVNDALLVSIALVMYVSIFLGWTVIKKMRKRSVSGWIRSVQSTN